ncbi:MAG: hypothetical protein PQJ60_11855 [Spirochaetales bacterium]|nr:hypothetical protein [Spirochaetales bacterium]
MLLCLGFGGCALLFQANGDSANGYLDWKLPEDYYVEAKMDMHLIYPRPEEETNEEARYKWAHTGITYEIPLGVQGGAWPFQYEILEGPDGATLGRVYGDVNYGNISWPVPETASGSYHFEVRVIDQEYDTLTIEWDVEIDNDMFVFIEDGYTGTQAGSIEEPLEDLADWYLDDRDDDTYKGRIVVLRGGDYELDGHGDVDDGDGNNNTYLGSNTKTRSFIAYPGEEPVVYCTYSKVFTHSNEAAEDFFVAGIEWTDGRTDVNNAHFFWMTYHATRAAFWNNTFSDLEAGLEGTDNASPVFFSRYSEKKENLLYKDNLFDGIYNDEGNGSYVDMYNVDYVLIEGNEAKNSNPTYGFWMKATNNYITVRNNIAVENVAGYQVTLGIANTSFGVIHDNEVCWNRILVDEDISKNSLLYAGDNDWLYKHYNDWIYRNSFIYGRPNLRFVGAENYWSEDNLLVTDYGSYYFKTDDEGNSIVDSYGDLLYDTEVDVVDEEGLLTGNYRSAYLGLKGAEIDTSLLSSGSD